MSEEAIADSVEVTETEVVETEAPGQPEDDSAFDMKDALDTMGNDLFNKGEKTEEAEVEKEEVKAENEEKEEKPDEKAEKEEKEPEAEKIDLPSSWKKDMQEKWDKLDIDSKKYVIEREEQMRNGLEKDRNDADLGRSMRDMMKPHEALFKAKGIDSVQAVQSLLGVHNTLSRGSLEQKQDLLNRLSEAYGVTKPAEGQDPRLNSLLQEVNSIKQNLTASEQRAQQAESARIESEVSAFADEHPLFDELQDDMALLIRADGSIGLEDAYEKALWANPTTRQKELDRLDKEKTANTEKTKKEEAELAKKAKSVNVKGIETNKAPTGQKGKFLDTATMLKTVDEIQSRKSK